jgi:hypothetical protein
MVRANESASILAPGWKVVGRLVGSVVAHGIGPQPQHRHRQGAGGEMTPIHIDLLEIVGYCGRFSPSDCPVTVAPLLRLRRDHSRHFVPPMRFRGMALVDAKEVDANELRQLYLDRDVTPFNVTVPVTFLHRLELRRDLTCAYDLDPRGLTAAELANHWAGRPL